MLQLKGQCLYDGTDDLILHRVCHATHPLQKRWQLIVLCENRWFCQHDEWQIGLTAFAHLCSGMPVPQEHPRAFDRAREIRQAVGADPKLV